MKLFKKLTVFAILIFTLIFTSYPMTSMAASVKINKTKVTLYTKQTTTLKITGTKKKVTWTSTDRSVASVNSSGKVTALKVGKATIKAKVGTKTYKCQVTVKKPYLSTTKITVEIGKSKTLKLTGAAIKSANSSNTKVASVTKNGKVTAKKAGTATITIKDTKNRTYTCKVTVPVRSTATKFNYKLKENETLTVSNLVFNKDVTISGENAVIFFNNCIFNGNITNKANVFTRVFLMDGTKVNGKCIVKNNNKEATIDSQLPKFLSETAIKVECNGCYGAAVGLSSKIKITFNGKVYRLKDSTLYWKDDFVPYEGQPANVFCVAQWWEDGKKVTFISCEE